MNMVKNIKYKFRSVLLKALYGNYFVNCDGKIADLDYYKLYYSQVTLFGANFIAQSVLNDYQVVFDSKNIIQSKKTKDKIDSLLQNPCFYKLKESKYPTRFYLKDTNYILFVHNNTFNWFDIITAKDSSFKETNPNRKHLVNVGVNPHDEIIYFIEHISFENIFDDIMKSDVPQETKDAILYNMDIFR